MAPKPKLPKKSKLPQKTSSEAASSNIADRPRPNWPPIQPVLPASDLSFNTLLPDQILTIPQLWTTGLCKAYVTFLSSLPLTTTPGKPKKGDAVRVNDRYQIDDANFAQLLWSSTGLQQMVEQTVIDDVELSADDRGRLWGGEVVGLNSNIRIYRYSAKQFFDQHYDDSNTVLFPSPESPNPVPARTTWTLLLYLTSAATGCIGGETVFYPEPASKRDPTPPPVVAELDVGMALLHRHGKDCLLHEGREVLQGEKWVIRSDLCVKR